MPETTAFRVARPQIIESLLASAPPFGRASTEAEGGALFALIAARLCTMRRQDIFAERKALSDRLHCHSVVRWNSIQWLAPRVGVDLRCAALPYKTKTNRTQRAARTDIGPGNTQQT